MRVVALTFHDVIDAEGKEESSKGDEFYNVRADEMEQLLGQLRKLGYHSASSHAFRAWQKGEGTLPDRSVVITFDDGYASHLELAAPLLVRHRFSGTFFLTTDFIGKPGYMSWEQLKKMVFLGMEIGSHGVTHKPLIKCTPEELIHEISESKRVLEQNLGIPIHTLAAPGGFWNASVAKAAKDAGYDAVWVSTIGTNGKETSPLGLRRVVVRRPFSIQNVVSMVEGWQPAFWWAANQQFLIRLLKRVLGVYRYEQLKKKLVPNA
jgi:peptidoglycan/xylan/chitin deacetylase (PgdA/CDA1 family)